VCGVSFIKMEIASRASGLVGLIDGYERFKAGKNCVSSSSLCVSELRVRKRAKISN
jgi:hypothetical protein